MISDLSQTATSIDNINVSVVADTSPAGLSKSMYFNGNASLTILGDALNQSVPYTIEMFIYVKSLTSIRLAPPILNPPSNITSSSFKLSWNSIDDVEYTLDIARDSQFNSILDGYRNKAIGSFNEYIVQNNNTLSSPLLSSTVAIGSKGAILKWQDVSNQAIAYKVDISRNQQFTDTLTLYKDRLTTNTYIDVGNIYTEDIELKTIISDSNNNSLNISNSPVRPAIS